MESILPLILVAATVLSVVAVLWLMDWWFLKPTRELDNSEFFKQRQAERNKAELCFTSHVPPPPPPKKKLTKESAFCCRCHKNVLVHVINGTYKPLCNECGSDELLPFRPDPPSPTPKSITKKPSDVKTTGRVIEFEEDTDG